MDRDQAVQPSWSWPRFLRRLHENSGQRLNVLKLHDHWHVYLGRMVRKPNHARKLEESCLCGMLLSSMDKSLLPDASILGHRSFHYSYSSDHIGCQNLLDNAGYHRHGLRQLLLRHRYGRQSTIRGRVHQQQRRQCLDGDVLHQHRQLKYS